MARSLQLTVPPARTGALRDALLATEGVLGLRVQRGIAVDPSGDVLSFEVLDAHLPGVMRLLDEHGLGADEGTSMLTSEPLAVVSRKHGASIIGDKNEASLEEIEQVMARAAHPTASVVALMAISGALAVVGIAENAIHLVVAAMLIAPGFVPIVRGSSVGSLAVVTSLPGLCIRCRRTAHSLPRRVPPLCCSLPLATTRRALPRPICLAAP